LAPRFLLGFLARELGLTFGLFLGSKPCQFDLAPSLLRLLALEFGLTPRLLQARLLLGQLLTLLFEFQHGLTPRFLCGSLSLKLSLPLCLFSRSLFLQFRLALCLLLRAQLLQFRLARGALFCLLTSRLLSRKPLRLKHVLLHDLRLDAFHLRLAHSARVVVHLEADG
jgi:hypothetical protein